MKKSIQMFLVLFLVLGLCGCADGKETDNPIQNDDIAVQNNDSQQSDENSQQNSEELSAWMKTKTGQFYSQFKDGKMTMEYEMEAEGMVMRVLSVTSGAKVYSETTVDGQSMGATILDEEFMYVIDHSSKTILQMSLETSAQAIVDTLIEEETADLNSLVSGTREIDGKTYETEELLDEGSKVVLCFDGNHLAYMIADMDGQEFVMKVIQMSNTADESLFELPEGYDIVSY